MEIPFILTPTMPSKGMPAPYIQAPTITSPATMLKNNLRGKSSWDEAEDALNARRHYLADRNNMDQVNSLADVVRSPIKSLLEGRGWGAIPKWGSDMVDYGKMVVTPIIKRDGGALINNAFNDFNETVDLIDNIWKGYAMTREDAGLQDRLAEDKKAEGKEFLQNFFAGSNKAGLRGISQALRGKNFDFDQNAWHVNFLREVASPTNIALLFSTAGVGTGIKAGGKKAATEMGEQLSKRATKKILANYTGDLGKAVAKANKRSILKAFNPTDLGVIKAAESLGTPLFNTHMKSMKLLAATNKMRGGIDLLDSIGPTLAVKTKITPVWFALSKSVSGGASAINYMTKAIDKTAWANIRPGSKLTLTSFVNSKAYKAVQEEHEVFSTIMGGLGTDIQYDSAAEYIRELAQIDTAMLRRVYRDAYATGSDKALMDSLGKEGNKIKFSDAEDFMHVKDAQTIQKNLDAFAVSASNGSIRTFKDYLQQLEKIYNMPGVHDAGVTELYFMAKKIQLLTIRNSDYARVLDDSVKSLKKIEDLEDMRVTHAASIERSVAISDELSEQAFILRKIKKEGLTDSNIKFLHERHDTNINNSLLTEQKLRNDLHLLNKQHSVPKAKLRGAQSELKRVIDSVGDRVRHHKATRKMDMPKPLNRKTLKYLQDPVVDKLVVRANKLDKEIATHTEGLVTYNKHVTDITEALESNRRQINAHIDALIKKLNTSKEHVEYIDDFLVGEFPEEKIVETLSLELYKIQEAVSRLPEALTRAEMDMRREVDMALEAYQKMLVDPKDLDTAAFASDLAATLKNLSSGITNYTPVDQSIEETFKRLNKALGGKDGGPSMTDYIANLGGVKVREGYEELASRIMDGTAKEELFTDLKDVQQLMTDIDVVKLQADMKELASTNADEINVLFDQAYFNVESAKESILDVLSDAGKSTTGLADKLEDAFLKIHVAKSDMNMLQDILANNTLTEANAIRQAGRLNVDLSGGAIKIMDARATTTAQARAVQELYEDAYKANRVVQPYELQDIVNHFRQNKTGAFAGVHDILETHKRVENLAQSLDNLVGKYTKDTNVTLGDIGKNLKEYEFTLAKMYQWFSIYSGEHTKALIDNVAFNKQDMPFMTAVRGVANIGSKELKEIQTLIAGGGNTEALARIKRIPILQKLVTKNGPDKLLSTLLEFQHLRDASAKVYSDLNAMGSFRKFLGRLHESELDIGTRDKLMDAMHSFNRNMDSQFLPVHNTFTDTTTDLEISNWQLANISKVVDQVDTLSSQTSKYNFKLENATSTLISMHKNGEIRDELMDEFLDIFENPEIAAHTAVADSIASVLLRKHFLKEKYDPTISKIFAVDVETDSLNKPFTNIHQVGTYDNVSKRSRLFVRVFDRPDVLEDDTLLLKLYSYIDKGTGNYAHTVAEARAIYNQIHYDGNMDAMYDLFKFKKGSVEIIPVKSEDELANYVENLMTEVKPDKGRMVVDMFNGTEFDVDVLNRLFKDPMFNKSNIQDSLIDMRADYGVTKMTAKERETMGNLLEEYAGIRKGDHITDGYRLGNNDVHGIVEPLPVKSTSTLIPGLNKDFDVALNKMIDAFDSNGTSHLTKSGVVMQTEAVQIVDIKKFKQERHDVFENLANVKKELSKYSISSEDVKHMHLNRVSGKDIYYEGVPTAMTSENNIMSHLMRVADEFGLSVPVITVRKVREEDIIYKMFNVTENANLPKRMVSYMTTLGQRVNNLHKSIKDLKYIDMENAVAVNKYLENVIRTTNIDHAYAHIMTQFKVTQDPLMAYAQSHSRFNMLKHTVHPHEFESIRHAIDKLAPPRVVKEGSQDMYSYTTGLDNPKLVRSFAERTYDPTFFTPTLNDKTQKIYDYVSGLLGFNIKTLEDFDRVTSELEFTTPIRRMLPVYRDMLESMELMTRELAGLEPQAKAIFFDTARASFEAAYALVAYDKLKNFLDMSPENMASYLWHWGKTKQFIDLRDLRSESFFRSHNKGRKLDLINNDLSGYYNKLMANKKAFEAQGIIITKKGKKIGFELDASRVDDYMKLPEFKIESDMDLSNNLDALLTPILVDEGAISAESLASLRKALEKMVESRRNLVDLAPSGATSTLEKLDIPAWRHAENKLGKFSDKAFTVEQLMDHHRFDGVPFNHTYLGSIDTIRDGLDFASYNPVKLMYNASQTLHEVLDAKVQYLNMMFSGEYKLATLTAEMTDQEVYNYFNNNKHLDLAFLGALNGKDYKVKKFILKGPKDVAKAKEFGAIVLDHHTYTTTVQTINNNRLPPAFRMLNKVILTPWKIGTMAYNLFTVARNWIDSGLKNVVTAEGDFKIFKYMAETTKNYWDYKALGAKVVTLAKKENISIDAATNMLFKNKQRISRKAYDEITFFKQNAASSGMIRALQQHYGDSLKKVYDSLNGERMGLGKREFAEFLRFPDAGVALSWAEKRFPESAIYQRKLMGSRMDFQLHKKAYALLDRYKGHELTINKVVDAMKNPVAKSYWSADAIKFYDDHIVKVQKLSFKEDIITKIMKSPLIDRSLDLHSDVEELLRIALFRYLRDTGSTIAQATSSVTKTHFDYSNKSMAEMWGEMLIPFSTFRRNSLVYWMTEIGEQPHLAQFVSKYQNAQIDHDEVSLDDISLHRGFNYHLRAGNVIDDEKGRAYKVMPSVIDSLQFIWAPEEYLSNSIHPITKQPLAWATMEPYDNETTEAFNLRRRRTLLSVTPLIGPTLNRWTNPNFSLIENMLIGGGVSKTWTPNGPRTTSKFGSYGEYNTTGPVGMKQFNSGTRRRKYIIPQSYDSNRYGPMTTSIKGATYNMRSNGNVYPSRFARRPKAWSRIMTNKNGVRAKLYALPTNRWTVELKANLVYYRIMRGY